MSLFLKVCGFLGLVSLAAFVASFLTFRDKKKTVVILYGGGLEADVSKMSASNVANVATSLGYDISLIRVRLNRLPKYFFGFNYIEDKLLQIDNPVVLNMVHGEWGEDGTAQELLDRMNIPYFGSSSFSSRITFYKDQFYEHIQDTITVPKWDFLTKLEYLDSEWVIKFPHIVKINNGGSSIGVYYISNPADIVKLCMTWDDDSKMIVQEFISGIEVGVVVSNGRVIGGVIPEYSNPILSYEDKYSDNSSRLISIDELPADLKSDLCDSAEIAYKKSDCCGFALIEFRLNKDNKWILLEVNTIPGMTKKSFVPCVFGKDRWKEMIRGMILEAKKRGSVSYVIYNLFWNIIALRFVLSLSFRIIKRVFWINF